MAAISRPLITAMAAPTGVVFACPERLPMALPCLRTDSLQTA